MMSDEAPCNAVLEVNGGVQCSAVEWSGVECSIPGVFDQYGRGLGSIVQAGLGGRWLHDTVLLCTVYSVHITVYDVQHALCTAHCTRCTVRFAEYT